MALFVVSRFNLFVCLNKKLYLQGPTYNEIEAPDPEVKDLVRYKITRRFDKEARPIHD